MELNRFLLFLQNVPGIGDASLRKLIVGRQFRGLKFEDLEDVLTWIKAHVAYFAKKDPILRLTLDDLKVANLKRREIEAASAKAGVSYLTFLDERYPRRFREMSQTKSCDFPVVLYYKGDLSILDSERVCAVIGTREPSPKAKDIGIETAKRMTNMGYVVVSGLAAGCDSLGHEGCLEAGGKTVAIVGTGLDVVFPKENAGLLDEILKKGGLVVSEYPVGFKGASYSFVQRDRLQAACADVVIPIQSGINGGTMHAAKAAIDKYAKRLWVVSPSLVDDGDASGNAYLIREYFAKEIKSLNDLDR